MKLTENGSYDPPAKVIRKANQAEYWLVEWDEKLILCLSYRPYGVIRHHIHRGVFEACYKWPFSQAK